MLALLRLTHLNQRLPKPVVRIGHLIVIVIKTRIQLDGLPERLDRLLVFLQTLVSLTEEVVWDRGYSVEVGKPSP